MNVSNSAPNCFTTVVFPVCRAPRRTSGFLNGEFRHSRKLLMQFRLKFITAPCLHKVWVIFDDFLHKVKVIFDSFMHKVRVILTCTLCVNARKVMEYKKTADFRLEIRREIQSEFLTIISPLRRLTQQTRFFHTVPPPALSRFLLRNCLVQCR